MFNLPPMNIFNRFLEKIVPPASEKFFLKLRELCALVHEGAQILKLAAGDGTLGSGDFTASIHAHEKKTDALTDGFHLLVRHTMIHPVDPDDLRDIANSLDTVMDTLDHYAWRMEAYHLKPSDSMIAMIGLIGEMTSEMNRLFDFLISNDLSGVDAAFRNISDLEKRADGIFHDTVKSLHAGGERCYTVEDEVLSILEACTDCCKDVGMFVVVMLERNR